MAQTFYSTNSGGGNTVMDHLLANCLALQSMFSGGSAPGSPVNGQGWYDDTNHIPYLRVNGAWKEFFAGKFFATNPDFNFLQAISMRLENTTALPSPAAGKVGQVIVNTGAAKAEVMVSATRNERFVSVGTGDYDAQFLPASAWVDDATNPPTAATKGTTPTVRGKLFSATNQKASAHYQVPPGYTDDVDLVLRTFWLLNAAETSGDDLNVQVDMVALKPNNNETPSATSIQIQTVGDIAALTADGALHTVDTVLDFDDGTVPIDPSDLLCLEVSRFSVATIPGAIFLGSKLLTVCNKLTE